MKKINTIDAVGHVLCHDITQIIKDVKKDVAFKKGHIVEHKDIEVLLSLGKQHLYVWEQNDNLVHENEAADVLCGICINKDMSVSPVKEGKIDLFAEIDGLLKIDVQKLNEINSLGEIIISTRHSNFPVKKGDKLAGTRIIPLVIEKEKLDSAKEIAEETPILELLPFKKMKVGIVTTGSEVYFGRIKDTFSPVIIDKIKQYNLTLAGHKIVNDDKDDITNAIDSLVKDGADMIICTGGMSVDPDDLTPSAIKELGADIVLYGAPVLPGAMFLLAYYKNNLPILGLPGCVMYAKSTIFDLVLPRIVAGERLTKDDIITLGHGGLCLCCDTCYFPNCCFGK